MTNEQNRIAELEAENLVLRMSLDMAEKEVAIDKELMLALANGSNKQVKELAELRAHLHQIKQEVTEMKSYIEHSREHYKRLHQQAPNVRLAEHAAIKVEVLGDFLEGLESII